MAKFIPTLEGFAKGTFASAVGLSTLSVGLLYYGQNYLIYPSAFPPGSRTEEVPTPDEFGLPYDDLTLYTSDDVKIKAYLLIQREDLQGEQVNIAMEGGQLAYRDRKFAASRPTVLMFHGNGGNAGHRIPLAKIFYLRMRCNVLMLSYRGYGHSEGSPSEAGIRIDAQTCLDYVTAHEVLGTTPVVLYGQSIGGAVSIDLASRNPQSIRALILENTFLSIPRLIPTAMPLLSPFAFLCHQKWDSATAITRIPKETPILMLSGSLDEIVPRAHMVGLWEIATGITPSGKSVDPKEVTSQDAATTKVEVETPSEDCKVVDGGRRVWKEFPAGTHNDTCVQQGYWQTIASFVDWLTELTSE